MEEETEPRRAPRNRGWHTINTEERYLGGIQPADVRGGGDPILDSLFFFLKEQLLMFIKAHHFCPFWFPEMPQGDVIFGKGSSCFKYSFSI